MSQELTGIERACLLHVHEKTIYGGKVVPSNPLHPTVLGLVDAGLLKATGSLMSFLGDGSQQLVLTEAGEAVVQKYIEGGLNATDRVRE